MDDMWKFWRSKYGIKIALRTYYPNELKSDPILIAAMGQLKAVELTIEERMAELREKFDETPKEESTKR